MNNNLQTIKAEHNKQIETKIYRDRQDASNAMNNFGEGMKGSIKNYAGQVDASAKQFNNIIQTLKDNDNLQFGMIKMPSVLQGTTNFDGLRESVAKGILSAIMESGGSAAAERGGRKGKMRTVLLHGNRDKLAVYLCGPERA